MTDDQFKQLPREQRRATWRLYRRHQNGCPTFKQFVARVEQAPADDCVMIKWQGIWIGIEPDGYTHS